MQFREGPALVIGEDLSTWLWGTLTETFSRLPLGSTLRRSAPQAGLGLQLLLQHCGALPCVMPSIVWRNRLTTGSLRRSLHEDFPQSPFMVKSFSCVCAIDEIELHTIYIDVS